MSALRINPAYIVVAVWWCPPLNYLNNHPHTIRLGKRDAIGHRRRRGVRVHQTAKHICARACTHTTSFICSRDAIYAVVDADHARRIASDFSWTNIQRERVYAQTLGHAVHCECTHNFGLNKCWYIYESTIANCLPWLEFAHSRRMLWHLTDIQLKPHARRPINPKYRKHQSPHNYISPTFYISRRIYKSPVCAMLVHLARLYSTDIRHLWLAFHTHHAN